MRRPRSSLGRWGEGRVTLYRRPSRSWVASRGLRRGSLSLRERGTRPSRALPKVVLAAGVSALLVGGVGCGEGEGVAAGATVTAYVEAPLCAGAERELASEGGRAGDVRVRAVCLGRVDDGKRLDLAAVGANARRATEDSAAVGYLEPPVTPSFSRPIVEAANIAAIRSSSGEAAMAQLLRAIGEADDSGSLRDQVRQTLN
jgi:hypothetical protein